MHIIWYGQSCFQINTSQNKSEKSVILINPFSKETGLRLPKIKADIVLFTHKSEYLLKPKEVPGSHFLITGPGEYESREIFIEGIANKSTFYTIETEKMRLCHLGGLGEKELTSEQLDRIGNIDILMIPVGGMGIISWKEALGIVSQIDPRIVIPMNYQIPKLKLSGKEKLEGVDKFLKGMGKQTIEFQDKLVIKHKDLSQDGVEIVVLKP